MKNTHQISATEAEIQYELMQRLLGPTLGRQKTDFLDPCVTRTFNAKFRAGHFLEMPEVVAELQGELQVEYVGPMPRAQKMNVVSSIREWMGDIAAMGEAFPDAKDLPEIDEIGKGMARMRGIPDKFITNQDAIDKKRADRKKTIAAAQKAAQVEASGNAAQSIGDGAKSVQEAGIDPAAIEGQVA